MGSEYDNFEETGEEKKSLSLKSASLLIAGVVFIVIIIMLTVRSCTVSKKVEPKVSTKNTSEVVLVEEDLSSEKEDEIDQKGEISEESGKNSSREDTESTAKGSENPTKNNVENGSENIESGNRVENPKNYPQEEGIDANEDSYKDSSQEELSGVSENKYGGFFNVDEPVLGESMETSTLVTGKKAYLVDDIFYTYSLSLIFPIDGGYEVIDYFCPKKTYDAVETGETVKAVYQMDKSGIVSITSISR